MHTEDLPQEQATPYEILGLSPSANLDEIDQAFKKAQIKYHPDRTGGIETDEFKKIKEAYGLLHQSTRRSSGRPEGAVPSEVNYDEHGQNGGDREDFEEPLRWSPYDGDDFPRYFKHKEEREPYLKRGYNEAVKEQKEKEAKNVDEWADEIESYPNYHELKGQPIRFVGMSMEKFVHFLRTHPNQAYPYSSFIVSTAEKCFEMLNPPKLEPDEDQFLEKTGFKKLMNGPEREEIFSYISRYKPETIYNVERCTIFALQHVLEVGYGERSTLLNPFLDWFTNAVSIQEKSVVAIYIRDEYLREHPELKA